MPRLLLLGVVPAGLIWGLTAPGDLLAIDHPAPPVSHLIPAFVMALGCASFLLGTALLLRARRGRRGQPIALELLVALALSAWFTWSFTFPRFIPSTVVHRTLPLPGVILLVAPCACLGVALYALMLLISKGAWRHPCVWLLFGGALVILLVVHARLALVTPGHRERYALTLPLLGVGIALVSTGGAHSSMRNVVRSLDTTFYDTMRYIAMLALGFGVPAFVLLTRPPKGTSGRAVLIAACALVVIAMVGRLIRQTEVRLRDDARLSALARQSNDWIYFVEWHRSFRVLEMIDANAEATYSGRDYPDWTLDDDIGIDAVNDLRDALREGYIAGGPFEIHPEFDWGTAHLEFTWKLADPRDMGIVAVAFRDVTDRFEAEQAVQQLNDDLRATLRRVEEAEDRERAGLAEKLHDGVVQMLYGVRLKAERPDRLAPGWFVDQLAAIANEARAITSNLYSPATDAATLDAALRREVLELQSSALAIDLRLDLDAELSPEVAKLVYRTMREAMRNVVLHAHARHAVMRVTANDAHVVAMVEDDGVGAHSDEIEAKRAEGHLGVVSMRENAVAAGGSFTMSERAGGGTVVRLEIPLQCVEPEPSTDPQPLSGA